jgi:hypothetical protein
MSPNIPSDNRALLVLDISANDIGAPGLKTISKALEGNATMTSLNVAKNAATNPVDTSGRIDDISGVVALANAIPYMGAMASLHVGFNGIPEKEMREILAIAMSKESMRILCEVPFKDKTVTELDVSGNDLGMDGALVVAEYLDGNGALSLANVMGNHIGKEMLSNLQEIMRSKPNLVSLCGIADDGTEADLFGLNMDADDAIILASELPDKRALSVLSLASNNLGELVLPQGWSEDWKADYSAQEYTHTDGSKQDQHPGKPEGIIALAIAISDMRALLILNMSKNSMKGAEAGKALGDALAANTVLKELDLSGQPSTPRRVAMPNMDIAFVEAFAPGLTDNRALTTLDISSNMLTGNTFVLGFKPDLTGACMSFDYNFLTPLPLCRYYRPS